MALGSGSILDTFPKCDFCSAPCPKDARRFEADAFLMDEASGGLPPLWSNGGWCACAECAALVDADKWEELVDRAVERHKLRHPVIMDGGAKLVRLLTERAYRRLRAALRHKAMNDLFQKKELHKMSWNASFSKPVPKREAAAAISALTTGGQIEGPALDQCELAKHVAHSLLPVIPGPYIQVSLSGHANGIGWQKKEGWSNDCINVSIVQITDPPTS